MKRTSQMLLADKSDISEILVIVARFCSVGLRCGARVAVRHGRIPSSGRVATCSTLGRSPRSPINAARDFTEAPKWPRQPLPAITPVTVLVKFPLFSTFICNQSSFTVLLCILVLVS